MGTKANPVDIARAGIEEGKRLKVDAIIVDTAGRLQVGCTGGGMCRLEGQLGRDTCVANVIYCLCLNQHIHYGLPFACLFGMGTTS